MPDVGKITIEITTPKEKIAEVQTQIQTALNSLKTAGKILYATGSSETKFEAESWAV